MKAMIFAAGMGTRLKPITDKLPKALVPVAGKPLLEHIILKLKSAGFNEIIVNVHHFPNQIIGFLKSKNNFGIRIEISDERDLLLDTGGGIRKTAWFFDDGKPFLVHNVDILSNMDLHALYRQHVRTNPLATLVVSERETFRYLLFNDDLRLQGWINEKTGETKPAGFKKPELYKKLAFSGIQILSSKIFDMMEKSEPKFPIMDFYLANSKTQNISGFIPENYRMIDVGKLDVLDEADKFI
ncbi:MAG: nucleotidyltransferase family protein [Paludibacter sp.]|nr:nucleotidyltransferase family protein [Paludibacter sp.]